MPDIKDDYESANKVNHSKFNKGKLPAEIQVRVLFLNDLTFGAFGSLTLRASLK